MAIYELTSPDGETYEINAPDNATEAQVMKYFHANREQIAEQETPQPKPPNFDSRPMIPGQSTSTITGQPVTQTQMRQTPGANMNFAKTEPYVRPVLEAGGGLLGATVGSGGAPIAGTIAGGALGYAGGKGIADKMYGRQPQGLPAQLAQTGKDIGVGAAMEMGGPAAMKVAGAVTKPVMGAFGKVGTEALGMTTGSGAGMVEGAIKGGSKFTNAMRGHTTGSEVVDNTLNAVRTLRSARGKAYTDQLSKLKLNKKSVSKVWDDVVDEVKTQISPDKFNIKLVPTGKGVDLDMSESVLIDKEGIIQKAISRVVNYTNHTPIGLDTLKKQLYILRDQTKRGTPQFKFINSLAKKVGDGLKQRVPGYAKMTKGYDEASTLIDDIDAGLMTRKQGMTGRVTEDMTLRRLTSAMREGFEMRKGLVEALSKEAGDDVFAEVAGYSASQVLPRGLVGKIAGGSAGYATYLNPKLIPLLAASSPRAVGEFLNIYGKALTETGMIKPAVTKAVGYGIGKGVESATQ